MAVSASSFALQTPLDRAYAGIIADLMGRFEEMGRAPFPPAAERMLQWTLLAGRRPDWITENAVDLRLCVKGETSVKPNEFTTWYYSMQGELTRPSGPGESISDWYDRLRRLHAFEFPTSRIEPYWRWERDIAGSLVYAGRGAVLSGPVGSGKTALCVKVLEAIEALKRDQIAFGARSTLAQMLGKKLGGGGTPDKEPDPNPDHLGLWYARDIRFVANFSIYSDTDHGRASPMLDRWHRFTRLTGAMTEAAVGEREGMFLVYAVDESAFAVDKYVQSSERVKAIVGLTRILRKLNGIILWLSQWGDDDFPKEVTRAASVRAVLDAPRGEKASGKGTFSIPGTPLNQRHLEDIPLPVSGFDTQQKPSLDPDLSMKDAMQFMADFENNWEREQSVAPPETRHKWGREERARSLEEAVAAQLRRAMPVRERP